MSNKSQTTKNTRTNAYKDNNPGDVQNQMPQVTSIVHPEQMNLLAHQNIQSYLGKIQREKLDQNDLNAVLRLSQHLRIFGLVSAVGYLNQSNAQENNETRKRTVPVWECLLGHLIDVNAPPTKNQLMQIVVEMARQKPSEYMATWRRSLVMANHWNFWARAYLEEKCTQGQN